MPAEINQQASWHNAQGGPVTPPMSAIAENRRSIQTCGFLRFRVIRVSGDPITRNRMVISGAIMHHQSPSLPLARNRPDWLCRGAAADANRRSFSPLHIACPHAVGSRRPSPSRTHRTPGGPQEDPIPPSRPPISPSSSPSHRQPQPSTAPDIQRSSPSQPQPAPAAASK